MKHYYKGREGLCLCKHWEITSDSINNVMEKQALLTIRGPNSANSSIVMKHIQDFSESAFKINFVVICIQLSAGRTW